MELTKQAAESIAPWIQSNAVIEAGAAERVRLWWERAQHVYPPNTQKAWRSDWKIFLEFCQPSGLSPLPVKSEDVAAFVFHCREAGKKPATVRRYLSTIAVAHRVAKLVNPIQDEAVTLELRRLDQERSVRQRQAKALGWEQIKRFLDTAGESLPAARECALVCVAYDTMARRSELIALDVEDIEFLQDGTGRALIRRSKTDQAGEGNTAYLSRTTIRYLNEWLKAVEITEGAIFRRVIGRGTAKDLPEGRGRIGGRLSVDGVAQAFKRVAEWIGMTADEAAQVSGHSIRVGAAQDLLALNIDLASVMQAGRWKTNRMPMRYGEHVLAARGGMARAAEVQGRSAK
jgi:integrase